MVNSTYSHPYQATANGQKTRTYKTAESRDRSAQLWADKIQQTVSLWEHSTSDGWSLVGNANPSLAEEGRWPCKVCEAPVEANPALYLSLSDDGTWTIWGADDGAQVVCSAHGHPQDDPELEKSLSGFLRKTLTDGE